MLHFQHVENRDGILGMCEEEAILMLPKFNTKKSRCWAKIFEFEMVFERGDKVMYLGERWTNDENVIHVDEKIERSSERII